MPPASRVIYDPSRFDAGWLFLIAGAGILSASLLVPAADDLAEAEFRRDRAMVLRDLHAERLDRHAAYLDAVKAADPAVMQSLAATQLNLLPASFEPLPGTPVPSSLPADQFAQLEPDPVPGPVRKRVGSVLERWATDDGSRLWLLALGAIFVLIGLIPPWNSASPARR